MGVKICAVCSDPACAAVSPQSVSVHPRAKDEAPPVWSNGALEEKRQDLQAKVEQEAIKLGSTEGPALGPVDAANGPATGASRKRRAAPPSGTSEETTTGETVGEAFKLATTWPSVDVSPQAWLALAAIARSQEKWSRATTAAQRRDWAAPVPAVPEQENTFVTPAPALPNSPAPAPVPKQFQLVQVSRPLHDNIVLPGQQIHVTDPQRNCFASVVPATVEPGATPSFTATPKLSGSTATRHPGYVAAQPR